MDQGLVYAGGRRHHRGTLRRRTLVIAALALCLGFGGVVARVARPRPAIVLTRTLEPSVAFPGSAASLDWPTGGQAAIAISGLGTIGSAGPTDPVPIASVAKVMTAYLTLADHPLSLGESGFTYTITKADVANLDHREKLDESVLPVVAGEHLSEYQLLEGMLLPSGNNIAAILASLDSGTMSRFLVQMNSTASALGLTGTHYTDPSGYLPSTVSTALDQLTLAQAAMANPVFAQIVDKARVTLPVVGTVANDDSLVHTDGFIGIKTGSDSLAEGCFAFADRRSVSGHEVTIFGVVLGQGRVQDGSVVQDALRTSQALANSVAANLELATLLPAGTVVADATRAGDHQAVNVTTTEALQAVGMKGHSEQLVVSLDRPGNQLRSGETLATVTMAEGGSPAGATPAPVTAYATGTIPG